MKLVSRITTLTKLFLRESESLLIAPLTLCNKEYKTSYYDHIIDIIVTHVHSWMFFLRERYRIRRSSAVAVTTADALFAECWGHSAKPGKHSTKALPSAVLGKGFAECRTRQRPLGKDFVGKNFFAECQKSTLGKVFAECQARTRQKNNCRQHLTPALSSA